MRGRRAFTLVEMIIGLVVVLLLFGWTTGAAQMILLVLDDTSERRSVQARVDQAFSLLREVADSAALGLPIDADSYRDAFGRIGNAPFNWEGPVSVADSSIAGTHRERSALRVVYAVPTGTYERIRAVEDAVIDGTRGVVTISAVPSLEFTDDDIDPVTGGRTTIKPWVVFGATTPLPMAARLVARPTTEGAGRTRISLARADDGTPRTIHANDELMHLRAAEFQVRVSDNADGTFDSTLYRDARNGTGIQPVVRGVVDARFELDDDARLLTVRLLLRGDKLHDEAMPLPDDWPTEWSGAIQPRFMRYRLFSETMMFELKNM